MERLVDENKYENVEYKRCLKLDLAKLYHFIDLVFPD